MDLAQLALKADSSELVRAKRDLDAMPASAKRAESATSSLAESYRKMGVAVGVAIVGATAAIATLIKSQINYADSLSKTSQKIGVSVEALSNFNYVAKQNGVEVNSMSNALKFLNINTQKAIEDTSNNATAFQKLGIELKGTGGELKATDVLMMEIADRISVMGDGAKKTAIAVEIFGKAGADLIPMLNGGAEGIRKLTAENKLLGGEISTNSAKQAEIFNDNLDKLKVSATGLGISLASDLLPALTEITNKMIAAVKESGLLKAALIGIGETAKTIMFGSDKQGMTNRMNFGIPNEINVLATKLKNDATGAYKLSAMEKKDIELKLKFLANEKNNLDAILNGTKELSEAKKELAEVETKQNDAAKNKSNTSVDKAKEYQKQLTEQIADIQAVNALLQQGMDIEDARLIIGETRKGATKAQINELQKQLAIQADIEEAEQARQDRLQVWIKTQQKAYDDELKAIEATKKANESAAAEYLRTVKKAEEDKRREYERTADQLNRSLTDALLRGFESGKGFARNFRDTLINMFKTLVLTPVINFILKPVSDGLAGLLGGNGGLGSMLTGSSSGGGFGGIFSDLGNIFTKSNQSIIGGIESLGASIANGMGGIRDTIGGFLGSNASLVANVASYGGAVLQLAQGNWAGAAGTAIGTALGGPLGGAIGSFLGGAVGSLFGGKKYKRYGTTVSGFQGAGGEYSKTGQGIIYDRSLGGADGLNDINKQFSNTLSSLLGAFGMQSNIGTSSGMYQRGKSKKSGGIFNVNLDGQDLGRVSDVVLKKASMEAVYKALVENVFGAGLVKVIQRTNLDAPIKALFAGLTDKDVVGKLVNDVIRLGKNSELVNKSLDITISQVALMATESNVAGEQFTKLTDTLLQVADQASTVGDRLIGLKGLISNGIGMAVPDSLKAYDEALRGINTASVEGREQFLNLLSIRETFSQFTSAIDGLKGNVKGALFGIVSDAERQQIMNQDLAAMFAELKMTVPGSIQELIALGKSIDYTTAEGLNLASVFPTLVNAFNTTRGAVDSLINSLTSSRFETFADFAIGSSLARQGVGLNQIPVRGASQGSDNQVAVLLTRLIAEVSEMKQSTQQTADNTLRTTRELEDIAGGNVTLSTQAA